MPSRPKASEPYGDILDYVRWRGDLSFTESPWNEIDGLIIATTTYMNFIFFDKAQDQSGEHGTGMNSLCCSPLPTK